MKTFKVGDRVRVDEGLGRGKGSATITSVAREYDFIVHHDAGDDWAYNKDELILLEDTMECTVNGVTYRQLRNITVKALILAGADDNYVEHFDLSHDITEPILIKYAIDYALHSSYDFQKLVAHGFVEVVEEALKPCPFCGGEAIWVTGKKNWIGCKKCRTNGRLHKSHQEAIEAWNKRV